MISLAPPEPAGPQSHGASILGRAARGSILNFAGAIITGFATFALTAVVTRLSTTQDDAGAFFAATSIFLIASNLGALGTANGLVYFISRARGQGELRDASSYMRIAAGPVLIVAAVITAGMVITAEPLARLVGEGRVDGFTAFLRVLAFGIPLAAVANIAMSATRGLGTMKPTAALDRVLRPALQLLLVAAVLVVGFDAGVPWAWTLPYAPMAVLAWLWWRRMRSQLPEQVPGVPKGYPGRFWRFCTPRALAGVAQLSMQRLGIVLVGALAGLAEAAIFTAASRFLVVGQMAAQAVSQSVQPLLGELLARGEIAEVKRLYQASTAWIVLVTWPFYLVLIIFASAVLTIFGADYVDGRGVLVVLCATMLAATACGMVDVVLIMAGKPTWNLVNVLVAFVVNIGLALLLIPQIGALGAAVGWAAGILLANLLPLLQVSFAIRVHPFGRATAVAFCLTSISFGAVPLLLRLVVDDSWLGLLLGLVIGTAVAAIGLWRFWRLLQLGVLLRALRRRRGRGTQSDATADAE